MLWLSGVPLLVIVTLQVHTASSHSEQFKILQSSINALKNQLRMDLKVEMDVLKTGIIKELNLEKRISNLYSRLEYKLLKFVNEVVDRKLGKVVKDLKNTTLARYKITEDLKVVRHKLEILEAARQADFSTLYMYLNNQVNRSDNVEDIDSHNTTSAFTHSTELNSKLILTEKSSGVFHEVDVFSGVVSHGPLRHPKSPDVVCDQQNQRVVYGGYARGQRNIASAFLNGTGVRILQNFSVSRMAIDHTRGFIFYTGGYGELNRMRTDGTNRTWLRSHDYPMSQALALNIQDKMVYFSKDSAETYIFSISYDGRRRNEFVVYTKFKRVTDLAYDNEADDLFIAVLNGDIHVVSTITHAKTLLKSNPVSYAPRMMHFNMGNLYTIIGEQSLLEVFDTNGTTIASYDLSPLKKNWNGLCLL